MPDIRKILRKLFSDMEAVTFYPTYGYREGNGWKIPMRAWVHEPRKMAEELVMLLAENIGDTDDHELANLALRIADIVADSESFEKVIFMFDNDPEQEQWRIMAEDGDHPRSDLNGNIEGSISLSKARASTLLEAQNAQNGWLTFRAISKDHTGAGRVRLIEREGLSVISDIDDTVKITGIPAGGEVVVRNTFFRDFMPAPEMAARYRNLGDVPFHYVSGGPWQLYGPLNEFIRRAGFPEGSFHMKSVPKNMLSPTTWKSLLKLIGDATVEQKTAQISDILRRFPERKFIFVGDSGEHDPEVYGQLRDTFGSQVQEIWVRDVVNARNVEPERLANMVVIEAAPLWDGVSQGQQVR